MWCVPVTQRKLTHGTRCTCRSARPFPSQSAQSTTRSWTWWKCRASAQSATSTCGCGRENAILARALGAVVPNHCALPVVVLEARPPVRCAQQRLQGAGQIDEAVAHQEEHGQERCEQIDVAEQDAALADEQSQDEGTRRLAPLGRDGERFQERDDTVLRDGLQQSRCAGQALQPGTERGQEGADQDNPLIGPGHVRDHQLATDGLSEPVGAREKEREGDSVRHPHLKLTQQRTPTLIRHLLVTQQ